MASKALDARLKHLHKSALLLAITSPATSAFLGSQYLEIADHADSEPRTSDLRHQGLCNACGSILIPGWSCHTIQGNAGHSKGRKSTDKRPHTTGSTSNATSKTTVWQCLRCKSKNRQSVQKSAKPRAVPRSAKSAQAQTVLTPSSDLGTSSGTSAPATPPPQVPGSTASVAPNLSSKKRAKARKQGGLQALLAKSKTEAATSGAGAGFGLDLMDFMKIN